MSFKAMDRLRNSSIHCLSSEYEPEISAFKKEKIAYWAIKVKGRRYVL